MEAAGLSEEKLRARAMWDAGDFPSIAKLIASSGELAAERAELTGSEEVLDVACGSGNATIPAARSGARVTGLDLVPSLLEAGRREAVEANVEIEWVEGDAENLPFDDASFDRVISVFGVMFAPDHQRAAAEIARVLRPGGRIALCNWTPEGAVGTFFRMMAGHMPPPPEGFQPPPLWGVEDHVRGLFAGTGIEPEFERSRVHWDFSSPDEGANLFIEKFGPVVTARQTLAPQGKWEAAERDIHAYFEEKAGSDGVVSYDGEYLVTTGTKAG
jgi:SAM-dependent methyltransferase